MTSARSEALVAERLILRRFTAADLPRLIAYRDDPEVARYQSWSPLTESSARALLAGLERSEPGTRGEWYQFAVALKPTNELIGDCALLVRADDTQQAEIGYTFARAFQRQGYATEAVLTLLRYMFDSLRLHRVIAQVDCRNDRSVALLERAGFRREAHCLQSFWLKGGWIDEYLYAMLRSEWRARGQVAKANA
ncbi:MAG TPA: GNAT family protein [Caldilineaceae bacterium]|nr:GNAT family protein [Caldilineaceae bacterium]